jgi:peroxiredoxin
MPVTIMEPPSARDDGDAVPEHQHSAQPKLVIHNAKDVDDIEAWLGTTTQMLQNKLDRLRAELRQILDPKERQALFETLERLRMLQIVEHGFTAGDILPEFSLPDAEERMVTSDELLARGPLVLAFFRGTSCPYCSLTLRALDEVRPAIERLGASLVVISPLRPQALAQAAEGRHLHLRLLSDPGEAYAKLCGVHYDMTEGQIAFYRGRGLDLEQLHAGSGWELPLAATFVAGRDAVITYAYVEVDWARRAEPANLVAAVERLASGG